MRRTVVLSLIAGGLIVIALFGGRALRPTPQTPPDVPPLTPPVLPSVPISRASVGDPVRLTAALSHSHLLPTSAGPVHLAVEVDAAGAKPVARAPLSIALVVDRSGSMAGEKLENARQAAREMIRRLSPTDQLAIVAYDSTVDVLVPLMPLAEGRARLLAAVDGIVDRGGTNLGGGLAEGLRELRRGDAARSLRRVILISDGRANEGETSPAVLARWAAQARQESISVSSMGVGLDYNEDLLMSLADQGGGSYHYIQDATALARIFSSELDNLFTTVARAMVLEVQPAAGVSVRSVYGYPLERNGGVLRVPLGDLPAGDRRSAVLELALQGLQPGVTPIVSVQLHYEDAAAASRPRSVRVSLQAGITDDLDLVRRGEDRLAMEQVETARASTISRQAIDLYERGRANEAQDLARRHAGLLEQIGRRLQSAQVQQESQVLQQLVEDIEDAPMPASVAGRGLRKKTKARAWIQFRQSSGPRPKPRGK